MFHKQIVEYAKDTTRDSHMQLIEEIRKPYNLLNVGIAVVSILLSVYFYFESRQKREPVYLSRPTSQIYNQANATPKLRLIDQAGRPIDGNVHVLEVSFWNHGRQPIEAADARTPIYIEFPPQTRLLEYSIVRQNKPSITDFKLTELPPRTKDRPRIALQWVHLDPGLGARLQFIYVGDKNPPITFVGDILDAEITDGASAVDRFGGTPALAILAALLGAITSELFKVTKKRIQTALPKWRRLLTLLLLFVLVYGSAMLVFWLFFMGKSAPV